MKLKRQNPFTALVLIMVLVIPVSLAAQDGPTTPKSPAQHHHWAPLAAPRALPKMSSKFTM